MGFQEQNWQRWGKFTFCCVSGLEGFEECLRNLQSTANFIAVSDIAQGYTEMNTTPHTRRVKTVFFAMRHALDDMQARQECMETMRELFRQFMFVLIQEKTKGEERKNISTSTLKSLSWK